MLVLLYLIPGIILCVAVVLERNILGVAAVAARNVLTFHATIGHGEGTGTAFLKIQQKKIQK